MQQFVRLGRHCFVGGLAGVTRDVIPFGAAVGNPALVRGINVLGMRRSGFPRRAILEAMALLRQVEKRRALGKTLEDVLYNLPPALAQGLVAKEIIDFVRCGSPRGIGLSSSA